MTGLALPADRRARIAVDLGAESCRVSLLRWVDAQPCIEIVHRFPNAPVEQNGSLRWNLSAICKGLDRGLRQSATIASEGIGSIGVDGWAVDYVRLSGDGRPLNDPYCYRDLRTASSFQAVHRRIAVERLYAVTGVQPLPLNTLYQLHADARAGVPGDAPWMNLPEYILHWLGGERVAEYTNATHTGLVDRTTKDWSPEIFAAAGLDLQAAPKIVPAGTDIGRLRGPLAELPAFGDTRLIATACHDTASAIAGIAAGPTEWAYISSGTWSLVGALLDRPCASEQARLQGFTNLGAAENRICFHKNVNGMWIVRQCMEHWARHGQSWTIQELIERAQEIPAPADILDLDDPDLLLTGNMPARINGQRRKLGHSAIEELPGNAPQLASLVFHSLAQKYAQVLRDMQQITGKTPKCIYIVGGGSRNLFLNRLTEEATGLTVQCGEVESSTLGNFKLQLACN